jgi:hypothetical protein
MMELLSVPFTSRRWTDSYEAMVTVHGLLRNEPEGLVFEFRRSEHSFGVRPRVEDPIRTVAIPWAEIQSLTYRRRFLGWGHLVLRTRSLRALDGIAIAQGNELVLPVSRAERLAARDLAATVEMNLADRRLAALDAAGPLALPPS